MRRLALDRLHSPSTLSTARSIRIFAVDRVPGVKTVAGGQPKQVLNPQAQAGADRLQALVRQQRKVREDELQEAKLRTAALTSSPATSKGGGRGGLGLRRITEALSTTIDGQDLAKDVVARAMRRRGLGMGMGRCQHTRDKVGGCRRLRVLYSPPRLALLTW